MLCYGIENYVTHFVPYWVPYFGINRNFIYRIESGQQNPTYSPLLVRNALINLLNFQDFRTTGKSFSRRLSGWLVSVFLNTLAFLPLWQPSGWFSEAGRTYTVSVKQFPAHLVLLVCAHGCVASGREYKRPCIRMRKLIHSWILDIEASSSDHEKAQSAILKYLQMQILTHKRQKHAFDAHEQLAPPAWLFINPTSCSKVPVMIFWTLAWLRAHSVHSFLIHTISITAFLLVDLKIVL
jgi:hypothetical protein